MRIIIAALTSFLIVTTHISSLYGVDVLRNFDYAGSPERARLFMLLLLSLYLIVEGFYRALQYVRLRDEASANAEKLEVQCQELGGKIEALEKELTAAKAQVSLAAAKSAKRDEFIDAEIVQLLSLLQGKGRFIDFLMDDITSYDDRQVGAAARVVHQGCSAVIREYFDIEPVFPGQEGSRLTLEAGFPREDYRLLGKVGDHPPYQGRVLHKGWKTKRIGLPRVVDAGASLAGRKVIAPIEVEVS